jgi:hypothetical protein
MSPIRKIAYGLSLTLMAYALWQGPFHGKWAEAAYYMAVSVSCELNARNVWGKDE